jgi:hypothetical protein
MKGIVNGRQICDCQCHPDWSWLHFGESRINFSDVDGIFLAERSGHFLIVEWKKPGETLPDAQLRVAVALANQPGQRFTVLVVHGPTGTPMQVQRVRPYTGRDLAAMRRALGPIDQTDRAQFQRRVDTWWNYVEGKIVGPQ